MTENDILEKVISKIKSLDENDGYIHQDEVLKLLRSYKKQPELHKKRRSFFQRVKSVLTKSQKPVKSLLKQIEEIERLDPLDKINKFHNYFYNYAFIIDPLKGKDQDSISVFVNENGLGVVVCDGISGEGEKSGDYAREFSQLMATHLTHFPQSNGKSKTNEIDQFLKHLSFGIKSVHSVLPYESGGTTLICGYHDTTQNALYISWMGDGHALYFNNQLTGFAKLLVPQRDKLKRLNAAVSSNGIVGKIISQIHMVTEGTIILATDGFELGNGKVLNHFVRIVLTKDNLQEALENWMNQLCCGQDNKEKSYFHPQKTDDRSMSIIRFKPKDN